MDFLYSQQVSEIDEKRLHNFIVFEPSSSRVQPVDVFLQGPQVFEFYENLINEVPFPETLKDQILHNRLQKISQMLELLQSPDNVIITKFFDKIWRRYSYISNLGELFLDFETLKQYLPDVAKDRDEALAPRALADMEDDDDSDSSKESGDGDGDESSDTETDEVLATDDADAKDA